MDSTTVTIRTGPLQIEVVSVHVLVISQDRKVKNGKKEVSLLKGMIKEHKNTRK